MIDPGMIASCDAELAAADTKLAQLLPTACLTREAQRLARARSYLSWARQELAYVDQPAPAELIINGFAVERPCRTSQVHG